MTKTFLALLLTVFVAAGCGGGGADGDSPSATAEVPVTALADLPDAEQARLQMVDLIERVRDEVIRLVPESAPWRWNRDENWADCTQEATGQKGLSVSTQNMISDISFDDAQWGLVFPAVQRVVAAEGLTNVSAMVDSSFNHDVRISSDDGRTLRLGSKEASLIKGYVACRRPAPEGIR
ncbi:LppA family lipoprotein [Mycobacterium sp. NPDC050041]|uniref:LppA family lipoprotein n=1 Tax=Mycobacterium sp. NPDC050041 TaxID=3364293 RepID=UPI003C2EE370